MAGLENPLTENLIASVDTLWGPLEVAELNRLGITISEVEVAYKALAKLPILDFYVVFFDFDVLVQTF